MAPERVPIAMSRRESLNPKALGWWGNPCSTVCRNKIDIITIHITNTIRQNEPSTNDLQQARQIQIKPWTKRRELNLQVSCIMSTECQTVSISERFWHISKNIATYYTQTHRKGLHFISFIEEHLIQK